VSQLPFTPTIIDGERAMTNTTAPGAALRAAWDRFRATQDEVREMVENTPRFKNNPQDRAKAYHGLMEAMAMSYNQAIAPRLHHPRIYSNIAWQTDIYTLGQNGPDLNYASAFLDGRLDYKMVGRFNDCVFILAQVMNYLSGHPESRCLGNFDLATFEVDPDGSFEIWLSATKKPGNWIPLEAKSHYNFILFRRFLLDPNHKLCELRIERVSDIAHDFYAADDFDEAAIIERIDRAGQFMKYLIQFFNIGLYDFYLGNAGELNKMRFLPRLTTSEIASPSSNYAMAVYSLEPDEALIIELDKAPDGVYWGFQTGNVWSRSHDLMRSWTNLNCSQIKPDADGAIRVVISHQDTGIANWMDTTGFKQGVVCFRNYRTEQEPVPKTRKVKLSELDAALPAKTARITPPQRAAAIASYREGLLKLYGE
jgi:hypothetical protein